ncbi:MAG TPA: hypothetical protein VL422_03270 [Miltoncostaea sp.]|nr:hypothetical protein [Miltoncostaea sp.]
MTGELDLVRRARPGAAPPDPAVEDAARRTLMTAIAQAAPAPATPPARRRRSRRRLLFVLVPLAVVAAGATAWAGYVGWGNVSPDSTAYRDAVAAAQAATPLPPGHHWSMTPIPATDPTDGGGVMVALASARMRVTMNAMCHWESAWLDAIDAGSAAGAARSEAAFRSLSGSIPIHREGQAEDVPSVDRAGHLLWIRIADTAARGDTRLMRRDLRLNCPGETRQPTAWG